jgi:hypothetical protein
MADSLMLELESVSSSDEAPVVPEQPTIVKTKVKDKDNDKAKDIVSGKANRKARARTKVGEDNKFS